MSIDNLNLPRYAQDQTPEQTEAVVLWLAALPLADLRSRQTQHRTQIVRAFRDDDVDLVRSEQLRFDMTTDAISRQQFGVPQPGEHS